MPKLPGAVTTCAHCQSLNLRFDQALALGDYDGLLREQCLRMKTDRSERIAGALGRLIVTRLGHELREADADGIVPVPMHTWRRLARGTNPPAAVATAIGAALKLPVYSHLLIRARNTRPQIGLSNPARFRNVRGELQVGPSYRFDDGPRILLVDDILTTGATCSEAARALKRAGAAQVTAVVAARTESY
ncbi:MAG: phosphoribosyltransferase family protein [Planctomycetota bacterium]